MRHAREDRGQSVEDLAGLISDRLGEAFTGQMVKNMEAGRKKVEAWLLPIVADAQRKPVTFYLYDEDPYLQSELSRVSSDAGAKILPFRKPGQRSGRLIAPAPNLADPAIA